MNNQVFQSRARSLILETRFDGAVYAPAVGVLGEPQALPETLKFGYFSSLFL